MKSASFKPRQDKKSALRTVYPSKAPTKQTDSLTAHPLLDAWLCQQIQPQPQNYLHTLRKRSN